MDDRILRKILCLFFGLGTQEGNRKTSAFIVVVVFLGSSLATRQSFYCNSTLSIISN